MNTENEINEEVRQLLNSLEEHGKNARRQQELSDLIDRLESSDTSLRGTKQSRNDVLSEVDASPSDVASRLDCFVVPPRNDRKRRKLYPLWWAMGVAAACLLLWLLVKPSAMRQPEMEQEILVDKTITVDSTKTEANDVVIEEPVFNEELLLAEEPTVAPQKVQIQKEKPRENVVETVPEQPVLAVVTPTEPIETTNSGSNTIPTENETPSAVQSPQRRVIRSLNLVCYECQKDPEPEVGPKPNMDNRTLFGQPQDPYMKNGSLAFEFKLN